MPASVQAAGMEAQGESLVSQGAGNGAESHLMAMRDSFKLAANSLTEFYKQSSHSYNAAY